MIIVTGGAGFIGSNLVKGLNREGLEDILVVDNLSNGAKFANLVDCRIHDYIDKKDFFDFVQQGKKLASSIKAVFHLGACSDTTEWDGRYMMHNNYQYSKLLLEYCVHDKIPFIYASSAAVYGKGNEFKEHSQYERPLNVYGYSKFLFDQYVRRYLHNEPQSPIVGLRYFNVYGPRESHKKKMASIGYQLYRQLRKRGTLRLFAASGGYADGEQRRDFIYVDDVVAVNIWFFKNSNKSGIFNVGTGKSQSFNEIANAIIGYCQHGTIEYISFPEKLQGHYQNFTQADISALRASGYDAKFQTVQQGMHSYLQWLQQQE